MMKFIGIDLGWKSQPSGLCCLEWVSGELHLLDLAQIEMVADVLAWLDNCVQEDNAIAAVDAPTIIPNLTGSRLPDKLTHKYFGRYHAGCYPANLGLGFAERTVNFGLELENRGFNHAPEITPRYLGRYQIEVFPHPAIVELFNLPLILKYKKGRLLERRLELIKLYKYIVEVLPTFTPALNLNFHPELFAEIPTTGKALKVLEDKLDSLICAYVGAYWWYWGKEKNVVLGDRANGYIVIPKREI
jgi:predicted RNase H-like nuclease